MAFYIEFIEEPEILKSTNPMAMSLFVILPLKTVKCKE
jgi:hypothetical protein